MGHLGQREAVASVWQSLFASTATVFLQDTFTGMLGEDLSPARRWRAARPQRTRWTCWMPKKTFFWRLARTEWDPSLAVARSRDFSYFFWIRHERFLLDLESLQAFMGAHPPCPFSHR